MGIADNLQTFESSSLDDCAARIQTGPRERLFERPPTPPTPPPPIKAVTNQLAGKTKLVTFDTKNPRFTSRSPAGNYIDGKRQQPNHQLAGDLSSFNT